MFISGLLFVGCFVGVFFSQGLVDGVAAVVGESAILHSDVLQQSQFVAMERRIDPSKNPYLFEQIYSSTLENIINKYIILGVAEKDTNIVVSNDEVDRALDQQIDSFILQAGSESLFLEMAGMTMRQVRSDYWQDIRDMMVVEKYQYSIIQNVDVSRVEVISFFNSFQDSIPKIPKKYNFSIIEIPFSSGENSETRVVKFINDLKDKIQYSGISFDSLAQLYSHDPGSAHLGGRLGFTQRGVLVKEFEEAAYSMEINEISGPIRSDFGYHLIKLLDKQGEKISTQHILRIIDFSEQDRQKTYNTIYNIYNQTKSGPMVFDSLSSVFSTEYNNLSGKYSNVTRSLVPDNIMIELKKISPGKLSLPIEVETGYLLIYYYNQKDEFVPDLESSWNIIYQYAKQKKQNSILDDLVKQARANIYINIFNN